MSEQKTISPLLDGFAMGSPIRDCNGIRCCPAIKENTDKKYIVKIISIPASQKQMDALLLAGAYKDPSEAMGYFRTQGEEVMEEAALLKKLSRLDGFLAYEGWQMEPITRYRLGFEVYLVGTYKRTFDKYIRSHAVTHLEAIQLGLDMCAALTVCRQAGALYVNLKPSNVFMSEKKEFRIGDLGFIQLDALSYTTLPDKYLSVYTAPELFDPMAVMNLSADTYSLGMLLYQLYNDGILPFKEKAPAEGLPSPLHADYELAEIIMKAIHPDPQQRYTDPADLGKALAAYQQRNEIKDEPITPMKQSKLLFWKHKKEDQPKSEDLPAENPEEVPAAPAEETAPSQADVFDLSQDEIAPEIPAEVEAVVMAEDEIQEEDAEESQADEPEESEVPAEEADPQPEEQEEPVLPEDPEKLEEDPQPTKTSELTRILEKADDLISHSLPEDMILPQAEDPFAFAQDVDELDSGDVPLEPLMEEEAEQPSAKKNEKKFMEQKPRRRKGLVTGLASLVLLAALGSGGFWFYQNSYLQTIDGLTVTGDQDHLVVTVDSQIPDEKLTVTCSNNYGFTQSKTLENGRASFTELQSNSMYTIQLDIQGFHKLQGKTSDIYTTEANTHIVSFTSVAGAEDGSVILNFTADGEEPDLWTVRYSAEGEDPKHKSFTGHTTTITGLSLGKVYTFSLETDGSVSLDGQTSLELMASRLILAQNLAVSSVTGNEITVSWEVPGDLLVNSWGVRCYDHYQYDETVTVTDTQAIFTGIDPSMEYTIEVTASGMTQPARTGITANPINVTSLSIDDSNSGKLTLTWEHLGDAPDGGWLVIYSVDGCEDQVVKADKATAVIRPWIPGGRYSISLQTADGTSVFNHLHSYTAPTAQDLNTYNLTKDMLAVNLVKTPEEEKWYCENLSAESYTTEFALGDSISVCLRSKDAFYLPGNKTDILYVIRDVYGNVFTSFSSLQEVYWKDIWNGGDTKNGELTLPKVPDHAGSFVLDLYFDAMAVASIPFTVK